MVASFQTGLTEQGVTRRQVDLAVAPYLHESGCAVGMPPRRAGALLDPQRRAKLEPGENFTLDWSRMEFTPDRVYLPQLRRDFPMRRLWPAPRKT